MSHKKAASFYRARAKGEEQERIHSPAVCGKVAPYKQKQTAAYTKDNNKSAWGNA
jgi:hypothetical protein